MKMVELVGRHLLHGVEELHVELGHELVLQLHLLLLAVYQLSLLRQSLLQLLVEHLLVL